MDITDRRISKIARGVSHFTTRTMREKGIGSAELDFIHTVRHHPGITQAEVCRILELDKGATARLAARLEAKGLIRREQNPEDRRSQLLFLTEAADELRSSKAHIESVFYEWLLEPLNSGEQEELARLLGILAQRCLEEKKAGFPNVTERLREEGTGEN